MNHIEASWLLYDYLRKEMEMGQKITPLKKAIESILFYMVEKKMQAGDRLPSERELAKLFNISRTTIRSALLSLVKENKLESRVGSGYYLSSSKIVRDLQDNSSTTQFYKNNKYEFNTKIVEEKTIIANKVLAKNLKVLIGSPLHVMKRIRYINQQPIMVETSYISEEIFRRLPQKDYTVDSLYDSFLQIGLSVERGTETISVGKPQKQEQRLLEISENQDVFFIRGVSVSSNNEIVEYFNSITRGDSVKFSTKLT